MKKISFSFAKKIFPKRKKVSHKGQNGRVFIIGGSCDFVGAPALSALSALSVLRSGADIVTVAAPEKPGYIINSFSPDIIVKKFKGNTFSKTHAKKILELQKNFDSVLIGPGIGTEKKTTAFIKLVVQQTHAPLVIDADAINALSKTVFKNPVLITPHAREFEDFCGEKIEGKNLKEKIELVKGTAKKFNCTILLKGVVDVISDGKKVALNKTGNPAMTVGGTGDVLAGLCASFCAQGINLFNSAILGAFVNGYAGNLVFREKGYSLIASDLIEKVSLVVKKLIK
jgi:ADP-dependent NAD(P)H-hydrate dehydratase / NAD(P)H-hydrate epimerase